MLAEPLDEPLRREPLARARVPFGRCLGSGAPRTSPEPRLDRRHDPSGPGGQDGDEQQRAEHRAEPGRLGTRDAAERLSGWPHQADERDSDNRPDRACRPSDQAGDEQLEGEKRAVGGRVGDEREVDGERACEPREGCAERERPGAGCAARDAERRGAGRGHANPFELEAERAPSHRRSAEHRDEREDDAELVVHRRSQVDSCDAARSDDDSLGAAHDPRRREERECEPPGDQPRRDREVDGAQSRERGSDGRPGEGGDRRRTCQRHEQRHRAEARRDHRAEADEDALTERRHPARTDEEAEGDRRRREVRVVREAVDRDVPR